MSRVATETTTSEVVRSGGNRRLVLVVILGALSAFGPLSIDMYLPALPRMSQEFGVTAAQTQLTLSGCLLGLATGQLISGPLSDARGRRRPLLIGVLAYAVASILCAFAPSMAALAVLRFVQGFAGAAGIVIARAIVRDLHSGVAAARFYSLLMLVNGLAPILAPIFGSQLLRVTSWRGVFVALALIGLALLVAVGSGLHETLPSERRQSGGLRATLSGFGGLVTDRSFIGYVLSGGLAFGAMFSYISGSPFVLQDIYGVSPQLFSVLFAINAFGLAGMGQVNGRLVGRVSPGRLLSLGLATNAVGGIGLLLIVATDALGLAGILPALFLVVASLGFIMPNATALALSNHPRTAGSASALIGVVQFLIGALAAPLVGIAGNRTALPMSLVIATLSILAACAFLFLARQAKQAVTAS